MTVDDIISRIDASLVAIAAEQKQLTAARAALTNGATAATTPVPTQPIITRLPRTPGYVQDLVLSALDQAEARTGRQVAALTGLNSRAAAMALTRLSHNGRITKAARGYLLPG